MALNQDGHASAHCCAGILDFPGNLWPCSRCKQDISHAHPACMRSCHDVQVESQTDLRLAAAELARRDLIDFCMDEACIHLQAKDRRQEKQEAVDKVLEVQVGR